MLFYCLIKYVIVFLKIMWLALLLRMLINSPGCGQGEKHDISYCVISLGIFHHRKIMSHYTV